MTTPDPQARPRGPGLRLGGLLLSVLAVAVALFYFNSDLRELGRRLARERHRGDPSSAADGDRNGASSGIAERKRLAAESTRTLVESPLHQNGLAAQQRWQRIGNLLARRGETTDAARARDMARLILDSLRLDTGPELRAEARAEERLLIEVFRARPIDPELASELAIIERLSAEFRALERGSGDEGG
jgi:hypothetical protein